jgi:P4 family phage/plasmid primase-like protien
MSKISQKSNELFKFLHTHTIPKESTQEITHTSMGKPWGKFNINDDDYPKFLKVYSDAMYDGGLHIVERHKSVSSLLVDIDFNVPRKKRYYTEYHITQLIEIINDVLREHIQLTHNKNLYSFVLEKPEPTPTNKGDMWKDGFHIIYPYCQLLTEIRHVILQLVYEAVACSNTFDGIPFANTLRDVIDESVIENNGILMYGSAKDGCKPYDVTHIYNSNGVNKLMSKYDKLDFPSILSTRKSADDYALSCIDQDAIDAIYNKLNKKKNRVDKKSVAMGGCDGNDIVRKSNKSRKDNMVNDETVNKVSTYEQVDIDFVKKLVNNMSVDRATSFNDWIRVGWCLFNIDSELLYDTWIEFSKKSTKFDESYCNKVWNDANIGGYNVGSLCMWSRMDNLAEYNNIMSERIKNFSKDCEYGTHYDMAVLLHKIYGYRFAFTYETKHGWYEFKNHRWHNMPGATTLNIIISEEMPDILFKLSNSINDDPCNAKDMDELQKKRKDKESLLDKIQKTRLRLKDHSYKKNIISECQSLFYVPKLLSKFDSDSKLICFNNGIYDCTDENNMIFRNGVPDDYITKCTHIDYIECDENDPGLGEVETFFSQVQCDKENREFLLTVLASILINSNKEERLYIFSGLGANGKSRTIDLYAYAIGDYHGQIDNTMLTQKKGKLGAATPNISKLIGSRSLIMQEPEIDDVIQTGVMKEITGGDKIEARPLYSEVVVFTPTFTPIMICNSKPRLSSVDKATMRRIFVLRFNAEFVDPENYKGRPNQFLKNKNLLNNIPTWAPYFAYLLLSKYLPMYIKKGISIPQDVSDATEEYKCESDLIYEFFREKLKITFDKHDKICFTELIILFKEWFKVTNEGIKTPSRKEFREYLIRHDFEIIDNYVLGLVCISTVEFSD